MPASRSPHARLVALLGAAALGVLAGACGGNAASPPETSTAPTTATPATAAPATAAPASTSTMYPTTTNRASGATPTTAAPAGKLVVRAGGIDTIDFGAPAGRTVAYLEKRLGPAERSEGMPELCRDYTFASWKTPGITAIFNPDGSFAGWDLYKAGAAATPEGVDVGSDVATLRRLYGARFNLGESTLGHEFSVAEQPQGERSFSGLVDAASDGGKVTSLWSGFICAAR